MPNPIAAPDNAHRAFVFPVRVYYEDTDADGVVYYANYLKFMERARTEWLRARGLQQDRLRDEEGLIFAVRTATVEYLRSARFNDDLDVTAQPVQVSRVTVTFAQTVHRVADRSLTGASAVGQILCTGEFKIACLDAATLRPRRMPEFVLKELTR